ncbi:MAG: phenylpyruvate tautomerase MIF-related protein [Promethearchaeota archaeon]
MPYLKIQINQDFDEEKKAEIMDKISKLVAKKLGKPESMIMVALETATKMVFGGTNEPTIFMELKSVGLPESKTSDLSESLCDFAEQHLNVKKERIYIEFADAVKSMFGWKGKNILELFPD